MFILERVISLVAPHTCILCGTEGSLLCDWCLPDAWSAVPTRCYRCFVHNSDSSVCQKCQRTTILKHVFVASEYDDAAKELVHALKFGVKRQAAEIMAEFMAEQMPFMDETTLVVPVPTASSRARQRGFDQAELIAKALAQGKKLTYIKCLNRLGQTRQVGSQKKQREEQLIDSFWVSKTDRIQGKKILLVDDVLTTGASLDAAARALKKSGAKTIDAAVFAQAK